MDMNVEVLDFSIRKNTDNNDLPVKEEPQIKTEQDEEEELDIDEDDEQNNSSQPQRTGKRLQRMRPADEKLRAIERIRAGESKASVARDINVPESTIRGWCKSETAIRRSLQLKSPYDSETYSSASSNGIVGNSSDEENNPRRDQRRSTKKQKTEIPPHIDPLLTSNVLFQEHLVNLAHNDVKATSDLLWNWLMFNQRVLNQQMIPLMPLGQMGENQEVAVPIPLIVPPLESDRPRSADEAIAHGEKFLKWLEDCNDPTVTRFKVLQLKQLLNNLKVSRK